MINDSNAASASLSLSGGAEMLISYDTEVTIDGSLFPLKLDIMTRSRSKERNNLGGKSGFGITPGADL